VPAYIIAQINIADPQKYQEYVKPAGPASAQSEYQEARSKRLGAADFNMIIVEGG